MWSRKCNMKYIIQGKVFMNIHEYNITLKVMNTLYPGEEIYLACNSLNGVKEGQGRGLLSN